MKHKKYEPHIPPEITIRVKDNTQKPYYLHLTQNGWTINDQGEAYKYHDIQLDGNNLDIYMTDTIIYKNDKPHSEEPSAAKNYTLLGNHRNIKKLKRWIDNQNKLLAINYQTK